jgi:hypothetical protein
MRKLRPWPTQLGPMSLSPARRFSGIATSRLAGSGLLRKDVNEDLFRKYARDRDTTRREHLRSCSAVSDERADYRTVNGV